MGWTPFRLADGDTGYTEPNPNGSGYLYHGPDGKIYPTSGPNQQEAPGTPAIGTAPATTAAKPAAPAAPVNPAYINPKSVPQMNASTVSGVPNVSASKVNTSGLLGQSGLTSEDLSGGDFAKAIMGMLQPQFAQQQQQMNESLAAAGISGGSTAGAQTELANSQNSQTQGLLQPELLQLLSLQNTRDSTVASDLEQGAQFNSQQNLAAQDTNQAASLNAKEYNAGAKNTASSFNIANLLSAASGNQNAYNTFLQNLQNNNESTYLGDLGAVSGQAQTGQQLGSTAREATYTQPSYSGMNFGSALGSLGGATNATAQPNTYGASGYGTYPDGTAAG